MEQEPLQNALQPVLSDLCAAERKRLRADKGDDGLKLQVVGQGASVASLPLQDSQTCCCCCWRTKKAQDVRRSHRPSLPPSAREQQQASFSKG